MNEKTGIEKLRKLSHDTFAQLWSVLPSKYEREWGAETCGVMLSETLKVIADQIEHEHQSELNDMREAHGLLLHEVERKRELTDEPREVVERLRAAEFSHTLVPFTDIYEPIIGHSMPNTTSLKEDFYELCDRLIELLEHGGKQDVDVATLLELADDMRVKATNFITVGSGVLSFYEGCIRKAVEGAPVPDAESDAERSWAALMEWRDQVAVLLGIDYGSMADEVQDAIMSELDKRLMPPGCEWPRFEDGEKVDFGKRASINGVTVDVDEVSFVGFYGKLESRIAGLDPCANSRLHGPYGPLGERVKRPEPEVLGADGLPIKVGETVNNDYSTRTVSEVHASANPYGDDFPWVRYTDGEWDLASNVTHTPPDTQERIDADSHLNPIPYARDILHCKDWDKLTERQALRLMIADLMRRQRELDARTIGGE